MFEKRFGAARMTEPVPVLVGQALPQRHRPRLLLRAVDSADLAADRARGTDDLHHHPLRSCARQPQAQDNFVLRVAVLLLPDRLEHSAAVPE